ncbi:alpha/beta hydrolase [Gordonia sp. zg691]|uniref:Alpha/beta hydrolase n=1 Tax=Gordonia jinghuaiqii TaxID=2758710 RepID=A0A7D7R1A9_9ACTN|nr:alpha/beta hydrolase [Gordonia jinghuaiqii]MBD0863971.1 alpha/beta hydrolase [Gordonia jinghuaiqii]MCR5977914.1 alpha/beta fold hydrolase [Gordonia jinghuaiqii]QMT02571.1 alpha/beta hydrolase [Gordonia jinghuaiqii]
MIDIARPKIEGSIGVADGGRRIGFAEYGSATGRAIIWLHGTPGARRQIPVEARAYAADRHVRLIGLDRPGVGSSTPHRYADVADFAPDLEEVLEALGIDEFAVIGLSGGGPYALGVAHAMPDRVVAAGILGGVAPTVGPDRIGGGAMKLGSILAPIVDRAGAPIGKVLSTALGFARPIADPAITIYGRLSPQADRELLARPEFRAMFLDDLLHGGSQRMEAPFADVVVFARDWGFRVPDVRVPVRWWHGDHDHIIPYAHGEHMVSLLPDAKLFELSGESHLSTLHMATDIIDELLTLWDQSRPVLGE